MFVDGEGHGAASVCRVATLAWRGECGAQKRHAQQEIGARVVAELDDRLAHVGYRHGARGQVLPGDRRIIEQIRRGIVPCAGIMGGERDGKTAARYAIMLALNNYDSRDRSAGPEADLYL